MKKGFTLIELLVVIAIIGILSAIGLVSLNGAREKARDAQAKSDIGQMRTAITLFADDNSSKYPGTTASTANGQPAVADVGPDSAGGNDTANSIWDSTGGPIIDEYLEKELKSPQNVSGTTADQYGYIADDVLNLNADEYFLYYRLETGAGDRYYSIDSAGGVKDYTDNDTTAPTCTAGGVCAA